MAAFSKASRDTRAHLDGRARGLHERMCAIPYQISGKGCEADPHAPRTYARVVAARTPPPRARNVPFTHNPVICRGNMQSTPASRGRPPPPTAQPRVIYMDPTGTFFDFKNPTSPILVPVIIPSRWLADRNDVNDLLMRVLWTLRSLVMGRRGRLCVRLRMRIVRGARRC